MADFDLRPLPQPAQDSRALERVAFISLHTSPTASLGRSANGGLNVYVRELCAALAERGIASDVFTRSTSSPAPTVERLGRLSRVVYLPAGPPEASKYELFEHVGAFAEAVAGWSEAEGVAYDAIHSHYWLSGAAACSLRPVLRAPWVHTAHTLALTKNRLLAPGAVPEPELRVRVEGELARSADLLVVSTEAEAADLVGHYGVRRDRIEVIAPGVDPALFSPGSKSAARAKLGYPSKARLLLFVGRLERLKGVEVALRALPLASRVPDLHFAILGEDSRDAGESEMARLRALAEELGVTSRVQFRGSVPQAELRDHYRAADLCVMPSYSESFGLVGLEAQACGCPVMAADVAGLASVVRNGVTGRLLGSHEPADWAAGIEEVLLDPRTAEQLGRRGAMLAQRFTWGRTADRLSAALEDLVGSQARVHARALQE